ncbi:MAG: pantetheine-phosphate adenylyltransferase [Cytophagales bacterium]|nr:MAG: pantetheine-phosphate adenylyltransferase [Rhodothermaeota bacterium MED-G16]|tara:strand:- start:968 stop:1426 length:459 start_codon:yes stop_codon:yes gene_type:complete
MNKKIALFPGTFDPFTLGHHDIVIRGLKIFDEICVAIGNNPKKNRFFEVDFMKNKIINLYSQNSKISVISYNKLTAEVAKENKANYILRGLRNTTDFEFENSISQINRDLNKSLETVFLITSPNLAPISSTIIRDVINYGGDINKYLPYKID